MSLFVDTSVWYAAASTGDRHNARAKELLLDERRVLTDHVLVETWRLLAHRRFGCEPMTEGSACERVEDPDAGRLEVGMIVCHDG